MRLFEAIVDANHRAVAGDSSAGLHPAEFAEELPVIALTCIDPRLNALFPNALALPAEDFIWLRNAGNIITGPLSSTMRSLALACVVKGGREIAVIGHTDCQVGRTTMMQLLEGFKALGVERGALPENLGEFFGTFASERQNVIKACDIIRHSPLIGPKMPVHGLLVDVSTGKLEWLVNGYDNIVAPGEAPKPVMRNVDMLKSVGSPDGGAMNFSDGQIGDTTTKPEVRLVNQAEPEGAKVGEIPSNATQVAQYAEQHWPKPPAVPPAAPPLPPRRVPLPPPIKPRPFGRK
jgi:carbonic anhydrase